MREIKFRAWDTKRKKMWSAEEMGRDELTINPDGRGFVNVNDTSTKLSSYLPYFIPLQYIGKKDKHGNEVYEGHVCRFYPDPEEPQFFHGLAYIDNDCVGGSWKIISCDNEGGKLRLDSSSFWNDDFEIVGSIYELHSIALNRLGRCKKDAPRGERGCGNETD